MLRLRHESRYGRERGLSRQEVTEEGAAKLRGFHELQMEVLRQVELALAFTHKQLPVLLCMLM